MSALRAGAARRRCTLLQALRRGAIGRIGKPGLTRCLSLLQLCQTRFQLSKSVRCVPLAELRTRNNLRPNFTQVVYQFECTPVYFFLPAINELVWRDRVETLAGGKEHLRYFKMR